MLVGETGWAYIAGFFDGEGCVRAYCRTGRLTGYTARITIVQTGQRGLEVLENIREFLKQHEINSRVHSYLPRNLKHAKGHVLQIDGNKKLKAFLSRVFPYLQVKKAESQDVLRFTAMYGKVSRQSPILAMLMSESWNKPGVRERRIAGIKKAWADGRMPKSTAQSRKCMSESQKKRWEVRRAFR